jgi:hypothetical protein
MHRQFGSQNLFLLSQGVTSLRVSQNSRNFVQSSARLFSTNPAPSVSSSPSEESSPASKTAVKKNLKITLHGFTKFSHRLDLNMILTPRFQPIKIDPLLVKRDLYPSGKYELTFPAGKEIDIQSLQEYLSSTYPLSSSSSSSSTPSPSFSSSTVDSSSSTSVSSSTPGFSKYYITAEHSKFDPSDFISSRKLNIDNHTVRITWLANTILERHLYYWLEPYLIEKDGIKPYQVIEEAGSKIRLRDFFIRFVNSDEAERFIADRGVDILAGREVQLFHYQA